MKTLYALPLAALLFANSASAEKIWEDSYIELSGGGSIWARIDSESGCPFKLTVGSTSTNISGNASNCGDDQDGTWALHACGYINNVFRGNVDDALNEIVRRCQQD